MIQHQFELPVLPSNPFLPKSLPLISQLTKIGFHKYKNRWAKRFGKKMGRLIFDMGYHILGLGGEGQALMLLPENEVIITFNARHLHFGSIYLNTCRENYEPDVSSILSVLLKSDRVFFDIGSNWGYFSFLAASLPEYSGKIHAFEPTRTTYNDLTSLVEQAGLGTRIKCHPVALSSEKGHGYLEVDNFSSGLNKLLPCNEITGDNKGVKTPIIPIDELDGPIPDVLKIDAENHEHNILLGGMQTIEKNYPFIIIENWYKLQTADSSLQPLQLLSDMGYILFYPTLHLDGQMVRFDNYAEVKLASANTKKIIYSSFKTTERPNLPDQVNVFACHNSHLDTFLTTLISSNSPGIGGRV